MEECIILKGKLLNSIYPTVIETFNGETFLFYDGKKIEFSSLPECARYIVENQIMIPRRFTQLFRHWVIDKKRCEGCLFNGGKR
jgi:hypothetical protein